MKEEQKYNGSKTRNYFTAYLLASIRGKRLRYLEKQQKILFAEENLEDKEYTDADISPEERLELEQKEQLLMEEAQGIYPEWNEMTDISLIEAMFSLQEEERKLIYQHVFEERTFKEMSILNQMTEERCKGAYYWAIRKIRKRMGKEIMNFKELLYRARQGDEDAILEIFEMYRPLLIKNALVDGIFDEDLYQELTAELLKCIRYFRDVE